MSQLTDRLRGILPAPALASPFPSESRIPSPESPDLRPLGGEWRQSGGGSCFVVERRQEPTAIHGRNTVGAIAGQLEAASAEGPLVAAGAPVRTPFVFFDLETTGLRGGAGTYAFLVGCGWFEPDGGFLTRQFMLARFADERPLLVTVTGELARAGALVSFNGKSFDAPLIETRCLFHRLDWIGARMPHLDVLHPARRFWENPDCSLLALERRVLGARRAGDVPGSEIPARYFQFVRSGDAQPLAAVLEHNRLDLLSLAGMTARLLHLVRVGSSGAHDACEAMALGRVYARAGMESRALDAYRHAAAAIPPDGGSWPPITIAALRSLALALRRARQFEDAAEVWRRLLDVPGCPRSIAREANEALAIHHEHRARDLVMAKEFALGCFDRTRAGCNEAVRHRLSRIERKMSAGVEGKRVLLDPPAG